VWLPRNARIHEGGTVSVSSSATQTKGVAPKPYVNAISVRFDIYYSPSPVSLPIAWPLGQRLPDEVIARKRNAIYLADQGVVFKFNLV
jgi:hypothetical protein